MIFQVFYPQDLTPCLTYWHVRIIGILHWATGLHTQSVSIEIIQKKISLESVQNKNFKFSKCSPSPLDPSNINILEKPQTPPGQLCPTNWDYFGGSCYLLRNQVIIFKMFGENDNFICKYQNIYGPLTLREIHIERLKIENFQPNGNVNVFVWQELFPGELVTTLYKASWYTAKVSLNVWNYKNLIHWLIFVYRFNYTHS